MRRPMLQLYYKKSLFSAVLTILLPLAAARASSIDTSSCDALSGADNGVSVHALTNSEYATSVRDLLGISQDVGSGLPADALGGSFDTNASHTFTATSASSYLRAAQQAANLYINSGQAACSGQGFIPNCTADALIKLAAQAYRRPLLADEKLQLYNLPWNLTKGGMGPRDAYAAGLTAVLMAPQFIYRSQLVSGGGLNHVELYALAARLAYTLWSSPPDSTLLDLAGNGQLQDRDTLAGQVKRLLADPKAMRFSRAFAGQWLGMRYLAMAPAAAHLQPAVVQGFADETQAYFDEFLRTNRNLRDLLDARFSYVDDTLAQIYAVNYGNSRGPSRVDLDGTQRFGLLSQGTFLVLTSNPESPSAVKRGKWVLDNILCAAPPPPPAGVAMLDEVAKNLPMRERLAQHRTSPTCAGCHAKMDPIGLAFENYDQSGAWRTVDAYGNGIDPSGSLRAAAFSTPSQLNALLKDEPGFPRCVATKVATYALGRAPSAQESCRIKLIADQSRDPNYGIRDLLVDLSLSLLAQ